MSNSDHSESDFIRKITLIIEEHLSEENFGVSELADEIGMSRSNLLRKIQKHEELSVSQFIRKIRLEHAMELILEKNLSISEIAYEVGFGSVSYFIKCFHDQFGYPPGEAGNQKEKKVAVNKGAGSRKKYRPALLLILAAVVLILLTWQISSRIRSIPNDKSIAILPFINDSKDSSNVYFINGLMEAILTDLQRIEDLKVISRTSAEKYRNSNKTIPEIAKELGVSYILEGSGQKYKDQVMLHVQLIDSKTDEHIWAERYNRKLEDIFKLQNEIAKTIADQIHAVITPEEEHRIDKFPTKDLVAYDYYLKGREYYNRIDPASMPKAIEFFSHAIEHDTEFALAYADIAIAYFMIDMDNAEKQNSDSILSYAENSLRFDASLDKGLIAKALYFMNFEDYENALPYLEKALEVNPNSAVAINFLSEFYSDYLPNSAKYLEFSLKGIQLDIGSKDSLTRSNIYLHLGNAFLQNGFIEEASAFNDLSVSFNPSNFYAQYIEAYILFAKSHDPKALNKHLLETFHIDSSHLEILREVAKSYYYLRDYNNAYICYRKFLNVADAQGIDRYNHEDVKIGYVYKKLGLNDESEKLLNEFKLFADSDETIYKHLNLLLYFAYQHDAEKLLYHLEQFSEETGINYLYILFLNEDPLLDPFKDLPQFQELLRNIKLKNQEGHDAIRSRLSQQGLI